MILGANPATIIRPFSIIEARRPPNLFACSPAPNQVSKAPKTLSKRFSTAVFGSVFTSEKNSVNANLTVAVKACILFKSKIPLIISLTALPFFKKVSTNIFPTSLPR